MTTTMKSLTGRLLGALRLEEPAMWEKLVRDAVVRNEGMIDPVASDLKVSRSTAIRWIRKLRHAGVDLPAWSAGRHHVQHPAMDA